MSELCARKSEHQDGPEQRSEAGNQHQEAQREEISHHFDWTPPQAFLSAFYT
jgi:hypothetical protein